MTREPIASESGDGRLSRRRRLWLALLAVGLCVGNLFLHKPISDVCDWARARWGFSYYDRAALVGIPALTIAILLPLLLRRAGPLRQPGTGYIVLGLTVMTVCAQRWLLVANVELIHFPQFGLLAGLLLAVGLRADIAWGMGTLAGVLDEAYQHLVIYAGRNDTYLDFNDIVLNTLGAAWIAVLFGAPVDDRSGRRQSRNLTWPLTLACLLVLLPLALWWDPPWARPLLHATPAGNRYRILSPAEALLAAMLLGGMIELTHGRTGSARCHRRGAAGNSLAIKLCLLALAGCLFTALGCALAPPHRAALHPQLPFILTFWCGPPLSLLDDARALEIAAAGFTTVGPPCEGKISSALNRRALDVAARHGLRLWVADPRYHPSALDHPDWRARVTAAVAEYRQHPALGGYFVMDEPAGSEFADVARIVEALHAEDPDRPAYVNLLPDYIPLTGLEAASYDAYLDGFLAAVRPRLLSYDYYTFRTDGDRATFFTNLALIRQRALAYRIPFMLITLAMPHGLYRDPTAAELAWQAFHALAYGARGISYFAYWTPVRVAHADRQRFRSGLIEDGRPTPHYFDAMRINGEVRAIADELDGFRSIAVADSLGQIAAPLPLDRLAAIDGGAVTCGLFADDHGAVAALLVNRDYQDEVTVRLGFEQGTPLPHIFEPQTRRWTPLSQPIVSLAAGHGRLLRWRMAE